MSDKGKLTVEEAYAEWKRGTPLSQVKARVAGVKTLRGRFRKLAGTPAEFKKATAQHKANRAAQVEARASAPKAAKGTKAAPKKAAKATKVTKAPAPAAVKAPAKAKAPRKAAKAPAPAVAGTPAPAGSGAITGPGVGESSPDSQLPF